MVLGRRKAEDDGVPGQLQMADGGNLLGGRRRATVRSRTCVAGKGDVPCRAGGESGYGAASVAKSSVKTMTTEKSLHR